MTVELVTGRSGSAHISSADVGALIAGTAGDGVYFLSGAPTLTMTDANTLSVGACEVLAQGRHVRLTGENTVTVASGSQSGHRIDRVVLRYTLAADGTESVALAVVQGESTTGTAALPMLTYPASVLDGAQNADWEIARVSLSGLTPTASLVPSAIDPMTGRGAVLLYSSDTGASSVTLSDSASNFRAVVVKVGDSIGESGSTTVQPGGSGWVTWLNQGSTTWLNIQKVNVSGTTAKVIAGIAGPISAWTLGTWESSTGGRIFRVWGLR